MLRGKKTYLTAGIMALISVGEYLQIIPSEMHDNILAILAALGLSFARSGTMKKDEYESID